MIENRNLDILESICLTANGFHCFKDKELLPVSEKEMVAKMVIVTSSVPVLVPDVAEFAQPAEKFLFLQNPTAEVGDVVEEKFQNYRVIYSVPTSAAEKLALLNIQPHYKHILTASYTLLNTRFSDAFEQNALVIFPTQNHFLLMLFSKGELLVVNQFEYHSDADMLYYLLNVIAQFELNIAESVLYFLYSDSNRDNFLKSYFSIRNLL